MIVILPFLMVITACSNCNCPVIERQKRVKSLKVEVKNGTVSGKSLVNMFKINKALRVKESYYDDAIDTIKKEFGGLSEEAEPH